MDQKFQRWLHSLSVSPKRYFEINHHPSNMYVHKYLEIQTFIKLPMFFASIFV